MVKSYRDLEVYTRSFQLAMDIFWLSREFPREESYALTSQIVRASRSISSNITEGWAKRQFPNIFRRHLIDSIGSAAETENWLDFALACRCIKKEQHESLVDELQQIGRMIHKLHKNWKYYEK